MGKLYTVPVDGGPARDAGPDMGVAGSYLARRHQAGHQPQGPVLLAEVLPGGLPERRHGHGPGRQDLQGPDRLRRHGLLADVEPATATSTSSPTATPTPRPTSGASPRAAARPSKVTDFKDGDVRFPVDLAPTARRSSSSATSASGKLDLATGRSTPLHFDIAAETQESLTEFRDFNSTVDDYDVAPDGKRIAFAVHGEIFTAPTDEDGELRQITDGPVRDQDVALLARRQVARLRLRQDRPRGDLRRRRRRRRASRRRSPTSTPSSRRYIWSPDSKSIAFTTSDGKLYTIARRRART